MILGGCDIFYADVDILLCAVCTDHLSKFGQKLVDDDGI